MGSCKEQLDTHFLKCLYFLHDVKLEWGEAKQTVAVLPNHYNLKETKQITIARNDSLSNLPHRIEQISAGITASEERFKYHNALKHPALNFSGLIKCFLGHFETQTEEETPT